MHSDSAARAALLAFGLALCAGGGSAAAEDWPTAR